MLRLSVVLPYSAALLLVGSRSSPPPQAPDQELKSAAVREVKIRARDAYQRGEFRLAATEYRKGYELAMSMGARDAGLVCLNNTAGSELAAFDYTGALESFLNARRLAQELGNREVEAVIWLNLSSLYLTLQNYDAAEQAASRASEIAAKLRKFPYRAEALAEMGSFRIRHGDYSAGLRLFQEAINHAGDLGNDSLRATLNDRAGWTFMERGSYSEAEPYVIEAFRLRLLLHDRDLRSSYIAASRLKLGQGDITLASALIDRAAALPVYDAGPALWLAYYQRGLVRMAQDRIPEARAAFAQALDAADAWHAGAAFSDQARIASDVGTHELAQAFVEASVRLGKTPEAFLAAEQDRAAGLRQMMGNLRRSPVLSAELANTLGRLRDAETALLTSPPEAQTALPANPREAQTALPANPNDEPRNDEPRNVQRRRRVERLRNELSDLEAGRYLRTTAFHANITERTSSANTLRNIQDRIRPEEALLSFYPGAKETYLWALTSDHFEFHRLPRESVLADLATRTTSSVEDNLADRERLSEDLYQNLFGQLSQTVQRQKRWIITAGDALFRIPYPALIAARSEGHPVYLTELHSLEQIPSAWMLTQAGSKMPPGMFLGVGDGIYNAADPRWKGEVHRAGWLQLARLAASAREVDACGRQWAVRSPVTILTGARASLEKVEAAVQQRPAVIHFAAHFLFPGDRRDETVIDLGLNRRGQAELLTVEDVANLDTPDTVVVMSGCSSAAAGAAAGAGILGLSRAWLMAGASTIVGSLWPTPDDSGELFRHFYGHFIPDLRASDHDGPVERITADALQAAQIEMIRSATWRSEPRYWSAFYVMGKD